MKISLRKANAVQAAINEAIKNLNIETSVVLNEFQPVDEQISLVRERFFNRAEERKKLVWALYEIRGKVARANAKHDINDMLGNVAYLEKQISFSNMLASKGAQEPLVVLNGRLKKQQSEETSRHMYGYGNIETSIFTEDEIKEFRNDVANFKREKQKIQDRLLELNIQIQIELSDETTEFLESVDIL